ncbi:pseudouridine synthase [Cladochytrium replicatum]|nr:pseudouridine synthase [Cladochytrium replicatum]
MATAPQGDSQTYKLAILFGYNGKGYAGLERTKGAKTIENDLLTAMATIATQHSKQKITFVGISRASTTEEGEHAARQVLSLEIMGTPDPNMLDIDKVNALLPESVRVYAITRPGTDFSARRTCEARTYEYLLPTFVFAPPPASTHYANPVQEENLEPLVTEGPQESLFKTLKRAGTVSRKQSQRRMQTSAPAPPVPTASAGTSSAPQPYAVPGAQKFIDQEKKGLRGFFSSLRRGKQTEAVPADAENPRSPTAPTSNGDDEDFFTTVRRSMSRRATTRRQNSMRGGPSDAPEELERRFTEDEDALKNAEPVYFDPLDLPEPTESDRIRLRNYRLSERQFELLQHIVSLFRGTHNFHNYIPGAQYDDPRCYMRILNIECSRPEEHAGMEWVRIKVQAKAFARFQIRKMIALAVLVIRTNTPRAIVGNSFGWGKIDIPEAPGQFLILDQAHYDAYNAQVGNRSDGIWFDAVDGAVQQLRQRGIHSPIYKEEGNIMFFEEWIRSIDRYSFLYTYYLNPRGVVGARNAYIRPPPPMPSQ